MTAEHRDGVVVVPPNAFMTTDLQGSIKLERNVQNLTNESNESFTVDRSTIITCMHCIQHCIVSQCHLRSLAVAERPRDALCH